MAALGAVCGRTGQRHQAALLTGQFCSSLSWGSIGLGLSKQPGPGDPLPSPMVTFSAPKKAMGCYLQKPPCEDGQFLPTVGQGGDLGMPRTQQSLKANGLPAR